MPDGTPFMVMEYLEGHDLNQILRHHGPQLPAAVVDLMLQACEGMAEAHALGIVHRDIKPSNFFITRRPDGSTLLKILDFGISKTPAEVSELTGTQTVIGTPTYMAPEQMAVGALDRSAQRHLVDRRRDVPAARGPPAVRGRELRRSSCSRSAPTRRRRCTSRCRRACRRSCCAASRRIRSTAIQNVGELARMLAPYASDPLSAQQSAERAARILTAPRGSQRAVGSAGRPADVAGGADAQELEPDQRRCGPDGDAPGRARGRGMVIAGVATLCIVAGIGGFFVATSMKGVEGGGEPAGRVERARAQVADEDRADRGLTPAVAPPVA